MKPCRIVCAAMLHPVSKRIICGVRHYDAIMRGQIDATEGCKSWKGCDQGFVDNLGQFVTRAQALVIARENDQILYRVGGDSKKLYSENLY